MYRPGLSLTVKNAKTVLEAGLRAIANGQVGIDLTDVATVDSAAVAILLAWQRAAREQGKTLALTNLPLNLQSLIELYGVVELLQPAAVAKAHGGALHP